MKTKVINIRNASTRSQHPGWIYGGRGSSLGNPFIVGRDGTRDQVCDKYQAWVITNPAILAEIDKIKPGSVLGCYCKPHRCHLDWVAERIDARKHKR